MMSDTPRTAFEMHYKDFNLLGRKDNGDYNDYNLELTWKCWLTAWDASQATIEEQAETIKKLTDVLKFYAEPNELAREFHKHYEIFAKVNQLETQEDCKVEYDDLPDKNKRTMFGTCRAIGIRARQALEVNNVK
jgi:hypothetical protein